MRRALLLIAAFLVPSPCFSATSSSSLETLAKQLEQNKAPNLTLDKALLSALREPASTLEARTLPTTAAKYTASIETAWKLIPAGFIPEVWQHNPVAAGGATCSAMLAYWESDGLKMETFAYGPGNCPSVSSAVIARAWAWKLRNVGR
jgi:hypothetical protein